MSAARATLFTDLRAALPGDALLTREEELRPYECDGHCGYRGCRWPRLRRYA